MVVKPSSAAQSPVTTNEQLRTLSQIETQASDSFDGLAERVTETLKPLLKNPSDVKQVVTKVVRITEESYSGPTPHPEHLERIEAIAPGAARDIIGMALSEQRFRHRMSLLTVIYPYLGLSCGFILSGFLFFLAYRLGMAGRTFAAGSMIGVSALGVIGWFVKSRLEDRETSELQASRTRAAKRRRS